MKVYTKVVISMSTGKTLYEESYDYEGPVALCGGGQSGTVGFPEYMEQTHANWIRGQVTGGGPDFMTSSIVDLMNTAHGVGGNPYENESSFDPDASFTPTSGSPLYKISDQFTTSKAILDAVDPDALWGSFVTAAVAEYSSYSDIDFLDSLSTAISGLLTAVESALSSTAISDMVDSFEANKKPRFLKEIGLWAAGMADIGAVHTSSFAIGLALQQSEFSNSVDQYEREIKANIYTRIVQSGIDAYVKAQTLRINNKDNLMVQGPELMGKLEIIKDQLQTQLIGIKAEVERLTIVALKEQQDRQVELEAAEAKWDMEVYMYGANVMSSVSGSAAGRMAGPSQGQSILGGAFAGASLGAEMAAMGLVGGPLGVGIGLLAGGLLGWAMS